MCTLHLHVSVGPGRTRPIRHHHLTSRPVHVIRRPSSVIRRLSSAVRRPSSEPSTPLVAHFVLLGSFTHHFSVSGQLAAGIAACLHAALLSSSWSDLEVQSTVGVRTFSVKDNGLFQSRELHVSASTDLGCSSSRSAILFVDVNTILVYFYPLS